MPIKPTEQEEEYFARQEFERRRRTLEARRVEEEQAERRRVLAIVRGRCPKCAAPLVAIPFRGIEIDKCSECAGVWLDTHELERIVEGEGGFASALRRVFG